MKGTFVQIASIRLMRLRCRRTALSDEPRASRVGEPGVVQSSSSTHKDRRPWNQLNTVPATLRKGRPTGKRSAKLDADPGGSNDQPLTKRRVTLVSWKAGAQWRHPRSSSLAPRSEHEGTGNAEENALHRGRNGDSKRSAGNGQCNSLSSFASVYPLSPKFLSSGTPGPVSFLSWCRGEGELVR